MTAAEHAGGLYQAGTVDDALRYARIIWPEFIELDGMVFLEFERAAQPDLDDPGETLRSRFGNARTAMEREFNLISVPTLFASALTADEHDLERLAMLLRSTWAAKLHHDFPKRRFVVEVLTGDVDDPTLAFFTAVEPGIDPPS